MEYHDNFAQFLVRIGLSSNYEKLSKEEQTLILTIFLAQIPVYPTFTAHPRKNRLTVLAWGEIYARKITSPVTISRLHDKLKKKDLYDLPNWF